MDEIAVLKLLSATLVALLAGKLGAQSRAASPKWEILMQKPIPDDAIPKLSVFSLPAIPPAPAVPPPPGAGHTHAGPVFGYILHGEIENLVEPDPPAIYKTGEVFYETPMHVHRFLRNVSQTESANVLIFQAGDTGARAPAIKLLMEEAFLKMANQEVSLLRLTLPAGTVSEARTQSGPGIIYVLGGTIETLDTTGQSSVYRTKIYGAGDVFVESANRAGLRFTNASSEPAKLLLYQVIEKRGSSEAYR